MLWHYVIPVCVHLRIIVSEALVCLSMIIFRKEVLRKGSQLHTSVSFMFKLISSRDCVWHSAICTGSLILFMAIMGEPLTGDNDKSIEKNLIFQIKQLRNVLSIWEWYVENYQKLVTILNSSGHIHIHFLGCVNANYYEKIPHFRNRYRFHESFPSHTYAHDLILGIHHHSSGLLEESSSFSPGSHSLNTTLHLIRYSEPSYDQVKAFRGCLLSSK